MILLAGLGNPGADYAKHRHSIGFQFINYIAKQLDKNPDTDFITKKKKSDFLTTKYINDDTKKDVTLVKPLTFINNSGEAILFMAAFLRVKEDNILVMYDDMDLEFGEIRLRNSGDDSHHNGIKSVRSLLKKENFTRMHIGIGKPKDKKNNVIENEDKLVEYVLSDFTLVEDFLLDTIVFKHSYEIVKGFVEGGFEKAKKTLKKVGPIIKDELSKDPSLPGLD